VLPLVVSNVFGTLLQVDFSFTNKLKLAFSF